jgi:hypothetical protein
MYKRYAICSLPCLGSCSLGSVGAILGFSRDFRFSSTRALIGTHSIVKHTLPRTISFQTIVATVGSSCGEKKPIVVVSEDPNAGPYAFSACARRL